MNVALPLAVALLGLGVVLIAARPLVRVVALVVVVALVAWTYVRTARREGPG